ncbi:hypothetical protein BVY04_01295 [bacterium M21]|nr:hypothetical protein BVY04_01295 [bacterium M21]
MIVTYNGAEWVPKCLSSIFSSSIVPEVVVVDNASRDNTIEIVENDFPKAELIQLTTNIGFGQANNIGINTGMKLGAEYFFLVNQDTYLMSNCIDELYKSARERPEYGILSPVHLSYEGNQLNPSFANYLTESSPEVLSDYFLGQPRDFIDMKFVAAAFWFVPRKVFEETGGFDPVYFLYGEDNDLLTRIKNTGWKVGVVTSARGHHYHANTSIEKSSNTKDKRQLLNQFLEILKRPDRGLLYGILRFIRRALGIFLARTIQRMLLGYGVSGNNSALAAMEAICRLSKVRVSRKWIKHRGCFLSDDYIRALTEDGANQCSSIIDSV